MEEFYKDLARILSTENQKDNELEIIKEKIKALFNEIKHETSNKSDQSDKKKELIEELKKHIERINIQYHLKLDPIIKDGKINKKELEFACELIYQNSVTKSQIKIANKLVKIEREIEEAQKRLQNLQNLDNFVIEINKLIENLKQEKAKKTLFKSKKRRKLEGLKKQIIEKLNKNHLFDSEQIIKKINNEDLDSAQKSLKNIKNFLIEELNKKINELNKKKRDLKKEINFTDEQIKNLTSIFENSYVYVITHDMIIKKDLTKDIIVILMLLEEIENSNEKQFDIVQQIENSNEQKGHKL